MDTSLPPSPIAAVRLSGLDIFTASTTSAFWVGEQRQIISALHLLVSWTNLRRAMGTLQIRSRKEVGYAPHTWPQHHPGSTVPLTPPLLPCASTGGVRKTMV